MSMQKCSHAPDCRLAVCTSYFYSHRALLSSTCIPLPGIPQFAFCINDVSGEWCLGKHPVALLYSSYITFWATGAPLDYVLVSSGVHVEVLELSWNQWAGWSGGILVQIFTLGSQCCSWPELNVTECPPRPFCTWYTSAATCALLRKTARHMQATMSIPESFRKELRLGSLCL